MYHFAPNLNAINLVAANSAAAGRAPLRARHASSTAGLLGGAVTEIVFIALVCAAALLLLPHASISLGALPVIALL